MLRILTACIAASLMPATVAADEMKPKFGDIDGIYYTDVAYDREACRQAVKNKMALCRQNTGFISNTENRKFPGCLPLFREQSQVCADHFRSEAYKCEGSGSARIEDFTGFGCTVTQTVVEENDSDGTWGPADGADPWAADPGMAAGDPWAPEAAEEDPWAWDEAVPGANSRGSGPLNSRDPSRQETDNFDYNAALRALDGTDGMDQRVLPEDDYTAKLQELERQEAERRAAEIARDEERRARRLREEVAARQAEEQRAYTEAEEASRRAALEREAADAWQDSDDSYETYESESSDDTLFGGRDAVQEAFDKVLQEVLPQRRGAEQSDHWETGAPSDDGGYGDDCMIVGGEWVGADCGPELYRSRGTSSGNGGSIQ